MKRKGLVEKALYGNDKGDYTTNDYPKNRFEQFIRLFKTNWMVWILISILVTLAFSPLYVLSMAKGAYIIANQDGLKEAELNALSLTVNITYSVITIPFWILGFTVLQGFLGIIRRMSFKEGYLLWPDFKSSIKNGYKNTLVSSLIFSIALGICRINYNLLVLDLGLPAVLIYIILAVVVLANIFILAITLMNCCLNSIYTLSIKNMYKNSMLIVFANPLKGLMFLLIATIPALLIKLSPDFIMSVILMVIMLLFFTSVVIHIYYLYSLSLFDKYINKEKCIDIYRKGLKNEGN